MAPKPCHPERSSLRGCGVEGFPEDRSDVEDEEAIPTRWGSFDSLADSLAQDDRFGRSAVIPRVGAARRRGGAQDDRFGSFARGSTLKCALCLCVSVVQDAMAW